MLEQVTNLFQNVFVPTQLMINMKSSLISLAIVLVLAPLQASYGFLRCQGNLISEGDTKGEVLKKCGEPTEKDSRQQEVIRDANTFNMHKDIVTIDVWLYIRLKSVFSYS